MREEELGEIAEPRFTDSRAVDCAAMRARGISVGGLLGVAGLLATAAAGDSLEKLGIRVTTGAAAGYVADRECRTCHVSLWDSYQDVAMARSFRKATAANAPEVREAKFFHQTSGQRFELEAVGEKIVFRRQAVGPRGESLPAFETEVSWILGSGNHSRTYLYQTPAGELYQLPLAWYGQTQRWGMAPGYDRPDHDGVIRRVRRECMFCHNAYPEVPAGSDAYGEPPLFPTELPEGLGCQRCHGPGAAHLEAAYAESTTMAEVRAAIVNPGKLAAERRDDVCFGCHMQPSVALPGVRRFERHDYSFRPGEPLSSYLVQVDVEEEGRSRAERFEINHHPYRLRQSRCFEASGTRLSCLTCHDPHRKVPAAERAAHYRAACLGCHAPEGTSFRHPAVAAPGLDPAGSSDCVSCHMPQHRPQDVVQVVMTDHLIRRQPGGPELLAPRTESDPVLIDVRLTDGPAAPAGRLGELYRALTVARSSRQKEAVDRLDQLLTDERLDSPVPYLDLAESLLLGRRFERAGTVLEALLPRFPELPQLQAWLGLVKLQAGQPLAARQLLERAIAPRGNPSAPSFQPEARFNLGLVLLAQDEPALARTHLEAAVAERPNQAAAWYYLFVANRALGRSAEARAALERCLAIDPNHPRASAVATAAGR